MAFTAGSDGEIRVDVTANADPAADEIQSEFADAIAAAMKDPAVRAAVNALVKAMGQSFKGMTKDFAGAMKAMQGANRRATKSMSDEWRKVGEAARRSFKTPTSNSGVGTLEQQVAAITANMDQLAASSRRAMQVVEEVGRSARGVTRARAQEARDSTTLTAQAARERSAILQREQTEISANARVREALIRAEARGTADAMRRNLRIVELTWRAATQAVRGFVRAAGSALRGLRSVVQSVFSGIGRTIAASSRSFGNSFRGLGRGVASALSGVSRAFAAAFRRDEGALRSSLRNRENAMRQSISRQQRLQQQTSTGLLGALTGRGVGGGVAALAGGAGLAGILTSGFERFGQIETLQFRFERFLGSAEEAEALIERISNFSRTTSFDLPGVAALASNFLAMGQTADQAIVNIERLSDVTAFAGGNTESLERIQRALGQIISTGKLQGDELNQLAENLPGINIRQIIADQMGITTAELVAMQESGDISADAFINAFLTGIDDPRFQGAAVELAQTVTGRLANLKESFAIFGASLVSLVAGPLTSVFEKITDILNLAGGFISGDMFGLGGGGADAGENPFTEIVNRQSPTSQTVIPFEELPPELQDILHERNGWGPNQGYVLAAEHAEQLWDSLHPPEEVNEGLQELRGILIDVGKALGVLTGLVLGKSLFKLLGLGARFALSPMGLLVGAFAAAGFAFNRINKNSVIFRNAMSGLKSRLDPLKDALGNIAGAALSLLSTSIFGDGDFWKNIGDQVGEFVGWLSKGVGYFTDWLNWAAEMIRVGDLGAVFESAGDWVTKVLDNLETVPVIGPVVGFARRIIDALSGAFEDLGGFFADIWASIFDDDSTTGEAGGLSGMEERLFGTKSEQRSMGSRILDTMEGTFLGPVVRFFRGPFADGVESAISGVGDVVSSVIGWVQGGGLGRVWTEIRDFFAPIFNTIADVAVSAWERLSPIVQPLIDHVTDLFDAFKNLDFEDIDIGETIRNTLIGGLAGFAIGGLPGLAIGGLAGFFFDPLKEAFGIAWEQEIKPAWLGVWGRVLGWIADTFNAENLASWAPFIADFLINAGELVGDIATNPAFIGAIAGVAAAGVAVVALFTVGLIQGLAQGIVTWTELMGNALESAWEAVAPDFIPDPITNAISGMLGNAVTGGIALLGAGLLGGAIVKAVIGGITGFGPALISGAGGLIGMIFGRGKATSGGLVVGDSQTTGFSSLGAKMAGALAAGFLNFKFGEAAGQSGSEGAILLSLLTGAGTGAAFGFSIAGPLGAGIGAILGTAAAGLGAFFGNAQRAAREAKEETQEYLDVLSELDVGDDQVGAITGVLLGEVEDIGGDVRQAFIDAGFDFNAFVEDVIAGTEDIKGAFTGIVQAELFKGLEEGLVGRDETRAIEDFIDQVNQLEEVNVDNVRDLLAGDEAAENAFSALGIDANELLDIIGVLTGEAGSINSALSDLEANEALAALAEQGLNLEESIAAVNDSLDNGATGRQIAEMLDQRGVGTEQSLQAIADLAGEVETKIDDARTAISETLNVQTAPITLGGLALDFVNEFEGIENQIEAEGITIDSITAEVDDIVVEAATARTTDGVRQQILGLIDQGLEDGTITTTADASGLLAQIMQNAEDADLSPEATALIGSVVEDLQTALDSEGVQGLFTTLGSELANAETLAAAQTAAETLAQTGMLDPLSTAIEAGSGQVATSWNTMIALGVGGSGQGSLITGGLTTGSPAAKAGTNLVTQLAGGIKAAARQATGAARLVSLATALQFGSLSSAMFNAGANAGNALARGFISQVRSAAAAAAAVAIAVVQTVRNVLRISSPSKVFFDIGTQVGQGFIQGIKDAEGDMTNAIADGLERAVTAGTERAITAVTRAQAGQGIFDLLQPSILPGGTTNTAVTSSRLDIFNQIRGFTANTRESVSGAFGSTGSSELGNAIRAMQGMAVEMRFGFQETRDQLKEARAAQAAITEFNRIAAKAANRRTDAEKAIYERGRPAALTLQQRNILASSSASLSPASILGQTNLSTLTSALDTIREYGQTALAAGTPLNSVIANMKLYRQSLIAQARAAGLNATQVQALIHQFGLSDAALTSFRNNMISLNAGTIQGAENIQRFIEAASGIRDYASELLGAGVAPATVIAQIESLRNSLVNQATAMGFNRTEVNKLIDELGLSDTALTNFINQLNEFNKAAADATQVSKEAREEAARKKAEEEAGKDPTNLAVFQPGVRDVHVHLPFGNPEAVGMAVANRLAYDSLTSF